MTDHVSQLHDAHKHLGEALEHLENDRPNSAKRRVELARAAVGRVLQGMGYEEPTKATGAQGSNGQTDGSTGPRTAREWAERLFSPERAR
jgi:hypothetical protein